MDRVSPRRGLGADCHILRPTTGDRDPLAWPILGEEVR